MEDEVLNEIAEFAVKRLRNAYGHSTIAYVGDEMAIINSRNVNRAKITIQLEIEPKE